ncbi:MAG: hypothetical protein ACOCN9_01835 [Prevotella sp.]
MAESNTNTEKKTIEQAVVDTLVLENMNGHTINVAGQTYTFTDPTPATLMMVSAEVSKMPAIDAKTNNVLYEVLLKAKDARPIGRIAAILLLGAKRIKQNRIVPFCHQERKWSWRKFRFVNTWVKCSDQNELDYLTDRILEEVNTKTLAQFIWKRIREMQVGDFFGLTTSLSEINMIRATKEEVETAHGE